MYSNRPGQGIGQGRRQYAAGQCIFHRLYTVAVGGNAPGLIDDDEVVVFPNHRQILIKFAGFRQPRASELQLITLLEYRL